MKPFAMKELAARLRALLRRPGARSGLFSESELAA
jgi:DNA-binding response OmpR family regulator